VLQAWQKLNSECHVAYIHFFFYGYCGYLFPFFIKYTSTGPVVSSVASVRAKGKHSVLSIKRMVELLMKIEKGTSGIVWVRYRHHIWLRTKYPTWLRSQASQIRGPVPILTLVCYVTGQSNLVEGGCTM
jgi:hypothetical protein